MCVGGGEDKERIANSELVWGPFTQAISFTFSFYFVVISRNRRSWCICRHVQDGRMRIEQVSDGTLSRRALYSGRPTTTSWIKYPNFSGVDFRWSELPCPVRSISPMWPCSLFPLVSFPPALLGLRYSSSRLIGAWTSRRFASWWVVSYFFCIPTLPPFTGYRTKHIANAIRLSLLVPTCSARRFCFLPCQG